MEEFTPEQWVQELESGRWTCATGMLVSGPISGRHCCLGVAARMAGYTDRDLMRNHQILWVGWDVVRPVAYGEWEWQQINPDAPPPPAWLTAPVAYKLSAANDAQGVYPVDLIHELLIEEG